MTTAQIIFSVALGLITVIITLFAVFVISTTTWSGRWVRKSRPFGGNRDGEKR